MANRVAIVTGGGSGIGAAAAAALSAHGLDVAVVGRRTEPLEQVVASLPGRAVAVGADVGDPRAPEAIVERVLGELGRIDVLVNNAAVIRTGPLTDVTRASFDAHYAVNVAGPLFLVAAALPALRAGERRERDQHQLVGGLDRQARQHALRLDQGRAGIPHAGLGPRARARRDPRQLHRARARGYARSTPPTPTTSRRPTRIWAGGSRWAGSAILRTSPPGCGSWRRRRPRGRRGTSSTSTVGRCWGCPSPRAAERQ